MEFSRRFFIGSCLAAGASAGCSSFKGALSSRPIAKIGVLSDVHLNVPGDENYFLKALEYFRDNGADGVLIAGDIADKGRISQLRRAGEAWFKVFPDGKAPDGRKVEVCAGDGEKGRKVVEVKFPSARVVDGCRANEYEVTATLVEDDFDLVQAQRRVLAADFYLPASKCGKGNCCVFFLEELPKKGHYVFSVRPVECFGKKGTAISSGVFDVRP